MSRRRVTCSRAPNMQTLPWIIALAAVALAGLDDRRSWHCARTSARASRPRCPPNGRCRRGRCSAPTNGASTGCCARRCRTMSCCPSCRWCASASRPSRTKCASGTTCWAPIHVTFAVCSANGRVLAAIDLDTERGNSRRTMQIKQSVLGACRVRYLRCPVDNLPSVAELATARAAERARVARPDAGPGAAAAPGARRAGQPATRAAAPSALRCGRTRRMFQDSFFAPDNRLDTLGSSEFALARPQAASRAAPIRGESPTRRRGCATSRRRRRRRGRRSTLPGTRH